MDVLNSELVALAKQGDGKAFARLYSFYAMDMYRFAVYYTGNRHDAEDAVQDALVLAFRSIASLKKDNAFKSWLFKILSNSCKALLNNRGKNAQYIPFDELEERTGADEQTLFPEMPELQAAVSALGEDDRNIILLSVIGGYNSSEIAAVLGCPAATVRSKLSRTLTKLRNQLS